MTSFSTEPGAIRRFGCIAALLFSLVAGLSWFHGHRIAPAILALPAFTGALLALFPAPLRPVYCLWQRLGQLLGSAATALMLVFLYFGVITPVALLKRVCGGRPLPQHFDRRCATYWAPRTESAQPRERFSKRY